MIANADGRLEAFARGVDGAAHHIWQTAPKGGWSGWASLGGLFNSSLSVALNKNAKLEQVAINPAGEPYYNVQNPTPYWTGWRPLVWRPSCQVEP